jgi:copper chaperone
MTTATYLVEGMTCAHCVAAVTREVAAVPGVDEVSVELAGGRVEVSGDATAAQVSAAVGEAGYTFAGVLR